VSPGELAFSLVYAIGLVTASTYTLRSVVRRWRRTRESRDREAVLFVAPFVVVAVLWSASILAAVLFDLTQLGEAVRYAVGWVTLAGFFTAFVYAAVSERARNQRERG
jgi:bacteriorhodopsin